MRAEAWKEKRLQEREGAIMVGEDEMSERMRAVGACMEEAMREAMRPQEGDTEAARLRRAVEIARRKADDMERREAIREEVRRRREAQAKEEEEAKEEEKTRQREKLRGKITE